MSQVYVWDKLVRTFHWTLIMLFVLSYLTGDEQESIHTWSGYLITGLVLVRIIWGLVGSKYARFSNFVRNPFTIIRYLREIAGGNPKRYLGHNPAGGAMVVAILASLLMTTLSGMKLLAIEEGEGPFAQNIEMTLVDSAFADSDDEEYDDDDEYEHSESAYQDHEDEEEFWEEIHEFFVNLMLLLIVLHVLGVFLASSQHDESLVRSMVTGQKRSD